MTPITLQVTQLRAVALCRPPKDEKRLPLHHLRVEYAGDGGPVIAACMHGYYLFAGRLDAQLPEDEEPGAGAYQVNIPLDVIDRLPKKGTVELRRIEMDSWVLGDIGFTPKTNDFPPWRRMVPQSVYRGEQVPANFNPRFLAMGEKALYQFHGVKMPAGYTSTRLLHQGTGAAVMLLPGGEEHKAVFMVMPAVDKSGIVEYVRPSWAEGGA